MHKNNIVVGIPFFNERRNIEKLVHNLQLWNKKDSVDFVFFDDGSVDSAAKIIAHKGFKLITSDVNLGYGETIKRICNYATKNQYEYFVVFPGDFQRRFNDLERIIKFDTETDLVITSKLRSKSMPVQRRLGNYFFSLLFVIMFRIRPIDVLSGFKMYRTEYFSSWIKELPSEYAFDLCLIFVALNKKMRIKKISAHANYKNQTTKMRHSVPIMGGLMLMNLIAFIIRYYQKKSRFN